MTTETPRTLRPQSNRLTTQDASFLYGESFAGPLHIGSVSVFEGEIPFEDIVTAISRKLPQVQRYRQKLQFVPFNLAHATWEDDAAFDIRKHVKRSVVAGGATIEAAIAKAIQLHEPILDRSKPLWEIHSVEGVPGKTVVLSKVHHCLVDGVSGIDLMSVIFDFAPDAVLPDEQPWQPTPIPTPAEAWMRAMEDTFKSQVASAQQLVQRYTDPQEAAKQTQLLAETTRQLTQTMMAPIVGAPWNTGGAVTARRSFAWCKYPFASIRALRGPLGGTVNDIVLTILSEAAARYLAEKQIPLASGSLRIGCPVSVRTEGEAGAMGNRVSMMFPSLPARPMSPAERLQAVQKETGRIKEAREPQGLDLLMQASDLVPATLMGMASLVSMSTADAAANVAAALPPPPRPFLPIPAFGINFVATNVPGVQVPQYLCGHEMTDFVGLIPLAGTLAYGVAIGTYNQNLFFGMMAEPRLMPDVARMKALADEVYLELLEAAGVPLPSVDTEG